MRHPRPRRSPAWWALPPLLAGLTLLAADRASPRLPLHAGAHAAGPSQAPGPSQTAGIGYRLAATWAQRPWQLTPGRYGRVADITTTPDGTILVLDGRHHVVHVVAADGQPRGILRLPNLEPGTGWEVQRLDAGFDGTFVVLCLGPYEMTSIRPQRLYRLATDGRLLASIELQVLPQTQYVDVAVRGDGRIYLVRLGPQNPFVIWPGPTATPQASELPPTSGVDVLDADGHWLETIRPPQMDVPYGVDVDRAGAVYVLNRVPVPWHEPPEKGTPTPRPSWGEPTPPPSWLALEARPTMLSPDPRSPLLAPSPPSAMRALDPRHSLLAPAGRPSQPQSVLQRPTATPPAGDQPVEGVMFFTPDHAYLRTWPFAGAEDLAVGPGGLYLARQVEIVRVPEDEPLYTGPLGRVYAAMVDDVVFHLDVAADGRLRAGMSHCYFQGILDFGRQAAVGTAPALHGSLDRPELEGPVYPLRLTFADGRLAVLQGRYTIDGLRPNQRYLAHPFATEPQTIQIWGADGRLEGQWGVCSSSESWWVRDVAAAAGDIYTADAYLVQRRPDGGFPAGSYLPGLSLPASVPSRLTALAADGERVAVLDGAANRISLLNRSGAVEAEWFVAAEPETAIVDLALRRQQVYLADAGRRRVLVRGVDGSERASWPLVDAPRALAVGPTDDVFVLGSGGWVQRFRPDGERVALWPMPDPGLDALDLAVGDDGTVYVAFLGRDRTGLEARYANDPVFRIQPAGIWLFRETELPEAPSVPLAGCAASPDKLAAPRRLPLGGTVTVTLTVSGACPKRTEPAQVMLLMDTSRSMNWNNALERAKDAGLGLIRELAGSEAEIGLATFDDDPALRLPPTRDMAALRAALSGLQAWGDTHLAGGIQAAHQALADAGRPDVATQAIVILTDGAIKDDPSGAAEAARQAGIELYSWFFPTYEYEFAFWDAMASLVGGEDRLGRDPDASWLAAFASQLRHERATPGLFATITVRDRVPANMRYLPDSAQPAAAWDEGARTLVWTMGPTMAAEGLQLRYRLEPLATGHWPTNVSATASYTDVLGQPGRLVFPIPDVEVYAPRGEIYLPYLVRQTCSVRKQPLDIVLILDASSSMNGPAPGGGTKLEAAKRAAEEFLRLLRQTTDQVAVIGFHERAQIASGLTGDYGRAAEALGRLETGQGTAIDLGLRAAAEVLAAEGRPSALAIAILLSDGVPTLPGDPLAEAERLRQQGVILYAIGLGEDADATLLQALVGGADRYLYAPSADDLERVFQELAIRVDCDGG